MFSAIVRIVLTALWFAASAAHAQDYPSRPITIVVPLAAGTGMDIIARLYAEKLAVALGKPVVIENKPGVGFLVATQTLLSAPPDGHTLLVGAPSNLSYNHIIMKQVAYDPEKDLVPISHYLTSPFILVVNPTLPVQTVAEFIKYAREQPTPLSYSSPAGGGVPHFAVEVIKQRFDLKLTHVPYRSSPQSIVDIAAGHINFAFAEAGASQALIRDGKLRPLAVSSRQRLPAHPSIAPFAEVSGVADYEVVAWHMLVARSGTPQPILQRLNAEMKRIMSAPEMQQRISSHGADPARPGAARGNRPLHQVRDRQMADPAHRHRARGHAVTLFASCPALCRARRNGLRPAPASRKFVNEKAPAHWLGLCCLNGVASDQAAVSAAAVLFLCRAKVSALSAVAAGISSSGLVSCRLRCASFSFGPRCISFSFGLVNSSDLISPGLFPGQPFFDRGFFGRCLGGKFNRDSFVRFGLIGRSQGGGSVSRGHCCISFSFDLVCYSLDDKFISRGFFLS